jgi:pimeloyl-ACP methyl ester carboxylesterase
VDPAAIFGGGGGPRPPARRLLLAELRALAAWRPAPPDPVGLPRGEGRAVLVVPAFLTGDGFTAPLRRFLDRCGFRALGWGLGVNWGPTPGLLAALRARLLELHRAEQGASVGDPRVALVGLSLGGLMARHLAHAEPAAVRHVATLGSPIRLPTASPLAPLFRPLLPLYARGLDLGRLAERPPVPSTAIWTRQDGIVAWESCLPAEEDGAVEVAGAHMTLARNPAALAAVVRRLAAE